MLQINLEKSGIKVVYTRDEDVFIPLLDRTKIANDSNGKLFVSIHANANENRRVKGFETYILRPGKTQDAVQVAERATSAITGASTTVELGGVTMASTIGGASGGGANLAKVVADRFGIQLDMSNPAVHGSTVISGDIYLNATEEAITQLLGTGVEEKAYNFGFYTKVDLQAVGGDVTVNVNLQQQPGAGNTFKLDFKDLDVGVESFHNVVGADATPAAGIISSSAAGEFVHMDSQQDIALGNGGNDTYVVGANASGTYGGTALEYGNIGTGGGLANSASDAVNFNSVDSVDDLTFRRGKYRNEEEGSTLFIGDGNGNETVLFDNYNEYLDFRRVEFLTVEDGANDGEIYEIVTSANKNITDWDNEIYVAYGNTSTDVAVGGDDYIFGSSQADLVNLYLDGIIGSSDEVATIDLSGLNGSDTVNVVAGGNISETDAADAKTQLEAGIASGNDGKATITFDHDYNSSGTSKIIVEYDTVGTADDFTATYDYIG